MADILRNTHKLIAEKIAQELHFSTKNTRIFLDGSIGPDSHADFPHATGKDKKILRRIDEARALYFLNDEYAYGELGNALHYIQDKWFDNVPAEDNEIALTDDELFLNSIRKLPKPQKSLEQYLKIANTLLTVKNLGIEAWFNHSWGIWHKDYSSCIYVFADIVEMMLPTIQPNTSITNNKENLKHYVQSEDFKKATKDGFLASIKTNYLHPKVAGYSAAMYHLALLSPPANHNQTKEDLQITYRLSLEIARYTLAQTTIFKYKDSWTDKTIRNTNIPLALLAPQYHVLIPKPVDEVTEERRKNFSNDASNFLKEWQDTEQALSTLKQRSEKWKILLSGLMEMLKPDSH